MTLPVWLTVTGWALFIGWVTNLLPDATMLIWAVVLLLWLIWR